MHKIFVLSFDIHHPENLWPFSLDLFRKGVNLDGAGDLDFRVDFNPVHRWMANFPAYLRPRKAKQFVVAVVVPGSSQTSSCWGGGRTGCYHFTQKITPTSYRKAKQTRLVCKQQTITPRWPRWPPLMAIKWRLMSFLKIRLVDGFDHVIPLSLTSFRLISNGSMERWS